MPNTLDIEKFKAGHSERGSGYSYFVPVYINLQWLWKDASLTTLLEKASISLGELNSFARLVPDTALFIHLHVMKEAVVSSRIEGTHTGMNEALLPEEEISVEKRDDWLEVQNYTRAMQEAIKELDKLPLSSRLLKKTHRILLSGARGRHKQPGSFRTSQNWIGGATLNDAVFIPPAHTCVNELMSDLEMFLHNDHIQVPTLIRAGIAHYQFETIHPFLDGNGRIGRLLITLYLVSMKILDQPLLYLSVFFEQNKGLYYDNLMRARKKNDLLQWLKYFLVGIDETATRASQTLTEILKLKESTEALIKQKAGRRADSAMILLAHLFKNPVVKVKEVKEICSLSSKAANDLVSMFINLNILKEISGQTRYRIFVFTKYLDLFK